MDTRRARKDPKALVSGWLSEVIAGKYGAPFAETLIVRSLPSSAHRFMDPVEEFAKMRRGFKSIAVVEVG